MEPATSRVRDEPARGWSELRIAVPRDDQDALLLDIVAPWLREHRRAGSHPVFYLRERKGAEHRLGIWSQGSRSPAMLQLAHQIVGSGKASAAAVELVEDSTLDFAESTYAGPAAAELIGGLLAEATPMLLEAIARVDGSASRRNEIALALMVRHLRAVDFYAAWPERYPTANREVAWPRMFPVFRSHADGFAIMAKNPAATLAALDEQYEKLGARLRHQIEQLLALGAPDDDDASAGAAWYTIARHHLFLAEAALRDGGLVVRWDEGYIGDSHDISVSRFHQAFQHNEELRRFQRTDLGFTAMRFTMSALYLVLNNLGIRLIDRYFLCHSISRACQDLHGVDPAELALSHALRRRSVESAS